MCCLLKTLYLYLFHHGDVSSGASVGSEDRDGFSKDSDDESQPPALVDRHFDADDSSVGSDMLGLVSRQVVNSLAPSTTPSVSHPSVSLQPSKALDSVSEDEVIAQQDQPVLHQVDALQGIPSRHPR